MNPADEPLGAECDDALAQPWIAKRFECLKFQQWDGEDEVVVHDESSGQTHLLTELASALIRALADESRTSDQLAAQFSTWFEPSDTSGEISKHLHDVLVELQFTGLVAPLRTDPPTRS